jgi:hypothetical protein
MELKSLHEPNQTTMNTDFTEQPFNLETALKHPEWVYFRNGEKPLEWHWFEGMPAESCIITIHKGSYCTNNKIGFYNNDESGCAVDLILRVPYKEVWVQLFKNGTANWYFEKPLVTHTDVIACAPVKIPAI